MSVKNWLTQVMIDCWMLGLITGVVFAFIMDKLFR
jgi:hypothetical protein